MESGEDLEAERARERRELAVERDSKGAQRAKRGLLVIIMTKAPGKHPFNLLAYRHAVVPTIRAAQTPRTTHTHLRYPPPTAYNAANIMASPRVDDSRDPCSPLASSPLRPFSRVTLFSP